MKFPSLEEGPPKVRDAGGEGLCHTSGERGATQEHWGEGILGEPLGPAHSSDNDSQRAARCAAAARSAHARCPLGPEVSPGRASPAAARARGDVSGTVGSIVPRVSRDSPPTHTHTIRASLACLFCITLHHPFPADPPERP